MFSRARILVLGTALALVAAMVVLVLPLRPASASVTLPLTDKVIVFGSDGMRPDLVDQFAADGVMPTFADLIGSGVQGQNGMTQGFPPNTGVGWHTLATGTWPGEHGSTNNTFFRTGSAFTAQSRFSDLPPFAPTTGILQADTLLQAAERAEKTVVAMEWVGARVLIPALQGPVVDFRTFFSRRGVLVFPLDADEDDGAAEFNLEYQVASFETPTGWSNTPPGDDDVSPPKQAVLTVPTTSSSVNPTRNFDLYIFDSVDDDSPAYDTVLVVPEGAGKDASQAAAEFSEGEWVDLKFTLIGPRAGQTAGSWMKLVELAPDLSAFRLYFTSLARANATYNALGAAGSAAFEETLNSQFPTSTAADFAPIEAGIIDDVTHVEQGLMWEEAHYKYLDYILGSDPVETVDGDSIPALNVQADITFVGHPVTDEFQHMYLGLITPTEPGPGGTSIPNPFFDDLEGDGIADGRAAAREEFIQEAYVQADQTVARTRDLMGDPEEVTVFATSDHGFAPQNQAVNARFVLSQATVQGDAGTLPVHASGAIATANCGATITGPTPDLAKACWAGGTVQIYVNPSLPAGVTYQEVRDAVVEAFEDLTDPDVVDREVVDEIFLKEDLRDVDGSDSLHPNRSGDVVVTTLPPYQFDAAASGEAIVFSKFFGQHGYLPDLVDLTHNINLHAVFVAGGPGIAESSTPLPGVRAIDVAPTVAFLVGIPGPQSARGRILYDAIEGGGSLFEAMILNISDYHGQLVPLSELSDTELPSVPGPCPTSFPGVTCRIGGAAFLKPWFDLYEAETQGPTLIVAGGDSVGATPPISNFFEDRPTIELMNMMGFDLDALGNHNFDRGEEFLREELIPMADFKYVSANILHGATGDTPAEWSKSRVFNLGGIKLGVIGFSNEDIPELTKPGSLGPFVVSDPVAAVNKRAGQLLKSKVNAIVALGHLGVTSTPPPPPPVVKAEQPLLDLADNVANVDIVMGDHTNFQVNTTRPNGVLVTENLSKGARFTRVRLVFDSTTKELVYKTADFHRPWNIGVTPDQDIQSRIDELNAILFPILSQVLGQSTEAIPRSDRCGRADGRLCESLIGDTVTDAMRVQGVADFAITNAGGIRADLTCPQVDKPDDFCPPHGSGPAPFNITEGTVFEVLPFGNFLVNVEVTRAQIKSALENGVSLMPAANGRFPQVSGLCFTYDIAAPMNNRVTSIRHANPDGSCTTTEISSSGTFTVAISDFLSTGGDGYTVFKGLPVSSEGLTVDVALSDYIEANTPISPAFQDRITCTDSNGATAPNCPAFV